MPYVITTTYSLRPLGAMSRLSRRAVATLEEARQRVFEIAEDVYGIGRDVGAQVDACRSLTEAGGTVGPLPDGTVIEVARVPFHELMLRANIEPPENGMLDAEIIDAYNARESVAPDTYADGTPRHPFYCGECEVTHRRSEDCRA